MFHHDFPSVEKIDRVARKAVSSYSPMRPEPIIERRVAWRPIDENIPVSYADMRKQYSFGREYPDDLAREQ